MVYKFLQEFCLFFPQGLHVSLLFSGTPEVNTEHRESEKM